MDGGVTDLIGTPWLHEMVALRAQGREQAGGRKESSREEEDGGS